MKTIRQIADEIGVSKQAVQKRISREPLYTQLYPYISTNQGTKYIVDIGENLIKQAFLDKEPTTGKETVADNVYTEVVGDVHTLISMLQQELNIKNNQINELQQSNRELTAALENTTSSLQAAQALHAGTMHKQLVTGGGDQEEEPAAEQQKKKKGFFFWLKNE